MSEESKDVKYSVENPYIGSVQSVLGAQNVDPNHGLENDEVHKRLGEYGYNKLKEEQKTPIWKRFIEQFKDVMVLVLIVAAILSGFLGDWIEMIIIISVVIINAVLGVIQEGRAADAVAALQDMSSPTARVLRNGNQEIVKSQEIVPGDIIILEAGDIVPADARLIESSNMKADESALTGESVAVDKDAEFTTNEQVGIGDRVNMVFSSTAITYGRGKAIVTSAGQNTEMGKIAERLSNIEDEETPLQKNLNQLGKYLAAIVLGVILITFVVGIMKNGAILDMLMAAVALGVAAIPEGLSAVVTIVLAIGMNRMAEQNAIVKKLLAVETLGSVNYICSDKTGTLTKNEMTVTKLYTDKQVFEVSGKGYAPEGEIRNSKDNLIEADPILDRLMDIAVLCNEAELNKTRDDNWEIIGDPTEAAMLSVAGKYGKTRKETSKNYTRLGDLPFDSARKMMSVFYDGFDEGKISLTKGAPDVVINLCTKELTSEGVVELTDARRKEILEQNSEFAQNALRVLSFAYSEHNDGDFSDAEKDLVFVGFMGMIDPARPEAKKSIAVAHDAGIKVVMITGDHKDTAVAIAKDLDLLEEDSNVFTGAEIEAMSDEELRSVVGNTVVYARVSPEHKVRIVEALKEEGNIVSMTGDGVNDAPALKKADIGVAMGITGTEVSKSAADMILTDDNFSTIVDAVESGRVIYSNIRKFVGFLLSCNIGEVLVIFISMLVFGPDMLPLLPIQLLWLNLITDSFPALALGQEQAEPDIMDQDPRGKNAKILNADMIGSICVQAVAIFLAVFTAFMVGLNEYGIRMVDKQGDPIHETVFMYSDESIFSRDVVQAELIDGELKPMESGLKYEYNNGYFDKDGKQVNFQADNGALTFAFLTLILAELFRAYSNRSEHYSVFRLGVFSNKYLNKAILLSVALTLLVVYIPGVNTVFGTLAINFMDWLIILGLAFIPFIIGEFYKWVFHHETREQKEARIAAGKA